MLTRTIRPIRVPLWDSTRILRIIRIFTDKDKNSVDHRFVSTCHSEERSDEESPPSDARLETLSEAKSDICDLLKLPLCLAAAAGQGAAKSAPEAAGILFVDEGADPAGGLVTGL